MEIGAEIRVAVGLTPSRGGAGGEGRGHRPEHKEEREGVKSNRGGKNWGLHP